MVKTIVRCDRCSKEIGELEEYIHIQTGLAKMTMMGKIPFIHKYDLCQECYEVVTNVLKGASYV